MTKKTGLSRSERQRIQIQGRRFIDIEGLTAELDRLTYPLHFIDFETATAALPFHNGRRPYEQVAFQFSHHVVTESGLIEHRSQFIHTVRGQFPNFEFVRALKKALDSDGGTIFRYADHENTVLNQIATQLESSDEQDKNVLTDWIKTVTRPKSADKSRQPGQRCMVDLKDIIVRFIYLPLTGGSNSIKAVLPAILQDSKHLQAKYSKPIYGVQDGIESLNFKNKIWILIDPAGIVTDPYSLLMPIFSDISTDELTKTKHLFSSEDERVAEGAGAMIAYARMQFTEMSTLERDLTAQALLKYCELDTFAMVLIYEYWRLEVEMARAGTKITEEAGAL